MGFLLSSPTAERLYAAVKDLPIVDYHCHLSPQEIWEDRPFDNIGEVWLGGDHYKWRLMRTVGIDENDITGDASWQDKFYRYAEAVSLAAGHPLYHWSHMELAQFFGVRVPLSADTAEEIWQACAQVIREKQLSPRKLIAQSKVTCICTTDDIVDDLRHHQLLREDSTFQTEVLPSFRTDNLLLIRRGGYADYIARLSAACGIAVTDLATLEKAVAARLAFFVEMGCRVTDVGVPAFPHRVADAVEADGIFRKALAGDTVTDDEFGGFLGYMYVFLGRLYRQYDLVMQWHLSVMRNCNSVLFGTRGADCGVDCVGDAVAGKDLAFMLDTLAQNDALPATILYTLNPNAAEQMASIAAAFPRVCCGAAWWFCDHKRGIEQQLTVIAENSALGVFPGMLTDSRSFLSYARHDYFRRILCDLVGRWVEGEEYDEAAAFTLVKRLSFDNANKLVSKG